MVAGLGAGALLSPSQAGAYQDAPTPTQGISAQTGIQVTVTYSDPINVRSGPSTVDYPIIGQLSPGDVVPALGITRAGDWVQISFSGGTGWVYATFVSISGGEPMIIEPPPTPVRATATIDPTLAAAFNALPTQTRMPTFTPPPPLTIPVYTEESTGGSSGATGILILGLGLMGSIGLLVSFILRK